MTGWRTPFIDVVLCIVIVLLLLVHPPKKEDDAKPPGKLVFEMIWPADCRADIDLWVRSPGGTPVGYSRKSGRVLNLLRDDLGHAFDVTGGANIEVAYARWAADGEYVVNVHAYGDVSSCIKPLPVHVRVSRRDFTSVNVVSKTVHLTAKGQEITVARFTLKGDVVSNVHDLPVKLRSGQ